MIQATVLLALRATTAQKIHRSPLLAQWEPIIQSQEVTLWQIVLLALPPSLALTPDLRLTRLVSTVSLDTIALLVPSTLERTHAPVELTATTS